MHGIIFCSLLKNVVHVIWCVWSPYAQTRIKFRASFTRDMISHFLENWFKIILNLYEVGKSRNLKRFHINICVGYGKKFNRFRVSCDVRCPKPRYLHMWSLVTKCGDVWILGIQHRNLLETFFIFYHSLHMQWNGTSMSFVIFGLCMDFI